MFSSNTSAVSGDAVFIEDVMSTYLYTGNGSTQTITNGIDLSTKGGLVWAKMRSNGSTTGHVLSDTARGPSQKLDTSSTGASSNWTPYGISAFGSTGFTVADDGAGNYVTNNSGVNYVSWTFRKQPKFFDVVTYTGASPSSVTVNHNLGSVPGCIIIKCISDTVSWAVYHRSTGLGKILYLNGTQAASTDTTFITAVTSTSFTVGDNTFTNNSPSLTYVAYVFAHNAGGFGLTGTDNVISCGSFTTDSGGNFSEVNLGYEPQWLLIKNATTALGFTDWRIVDNMRGFTTSTDAYLAPNTSAAEASAGIARPTATGFAQDSSSVIREDTTYIYIAIRRGPMKVPTSGTSVFSNNLETSSTNPQTLTTGFPVDLSISTLKDVNSTIRYVLDRLRGSSVSSGVFLQTNGTNAETATSGLGFQNNTGLVDNGWWNTSGAIFWSFGRAPSFFDEVCFSTDSSGLYSGSHNLGVTPELLIFKTRGSVANWQVVSTQLSGAQYFLRLNSTIAQYDNTNTNYTATSTSFAIPNSGFLATSASYVGYFFATCAGVSKVGSYTGTGTTKQVDCGFTGGARFVLIKRTDSTGDWYVWDTARGIVSGNDPYLLLNSTAAETTGTDYIDPYSAGFEISSTAPAAINASGGTFIFLAIA